MRRDDGCKRKRGGGDSKYGEDDWWVHVANKNPGELQRMIQNLGIRDVSKFLSYAARFMPEFKFDSFIYDPRRGVMENQINEQIKVRGMVNGNLPVRKVELEQMRLVLVQKLETISKLDEEIQ